jgi:transposase
VRQIAEARVKTDKEDVKRLIRLLIADILPEVWVPPAHVRELRGLISYRQRLVTPALAGGAREELRWALVEAAWRAVRMSPYWKEQYEKFLKRMRRPKWWWHASCG